MTNATCYLERSKVREILLGQPDESLYITEEILREVDALPIHDVASIGARAQAEKVPHSGRSKASRMNDILLRMLEKKEFPISVQDMGGPNLGEQYRPAFTTLQNNGWITRERGVLTGRHYYRLTDIGRVKASTVPSTNSGGAA